MNITDILSKIPDYQSFLTVDELREKALELSKYPGVTLRDVGYSRKGDAIYCISIGESKRNALCFALPHPNEPIGAMTLVTLAEMFINDKPLLAETGFAWHLIFCIDPDGTRLNEGWFKPPFDISGYARGFFRPTGSEQVEWNFPINYKSLNFNTPMQETVVLMNLMQELKPEFMFSLHNTSFGGAYWYLSKNTGMLADKLATAALRQDIPLNLGEAEAGYLTQYVPAVYSGLSMKQYYDYTVRHTGNPPDINCGTCSFDYISEICDCLTLVAEVPYFYDPKTQDSSPSDITRREAVMRDAALSLAHSRRLEELCKPIRSLFSPENPFPKYLYDWINSGDSNYQAKSEWVKAPEFDKPATVSEKFDNLVLKRYAEALNFALLARACSFELNTKPGNSSLLTIQSDSLKECDSLLAFVADNSDVRVIPIRSLVAVQLESALAAVNALA